MSLPVGLDLDLLRAFVFIAEEGSFTRAGQRVGRTQSAVSMQVQRLEALLGQRLVVRGKGGSVSLSAQGRVLLEQARELLALNDRIVLGFRSPQVQGTVRLGTPDDYALRYLPQVLRRFAERHPSVQVEVLCLPSSLLVERLDAGELDLTLCSDGHEGTGRTAMPVWRGPLSWVTSTAYAPHKQNPLPLALATGDDCSWSLAATRALEAAGRRYRMAYSARSLTGTLTPVMAGLAVTVSPVTWLPEGLRAMRADEGMPGLPEFGILLLKAPGALQPVTDALAEYIVGTFREGMQAPRAA